MKTKRTLLLVALMFGALISTAQGSGKVNLKADIESGNDKADLQISIIDIATKDLIKRDLVSDLYFCTLPLNSKYMVHFKKEGHPATRLIVDTNAPLEVSYFLNFKLTLNNSASDLETGISQSVGKIAFDSSTGNFGLFQEGASAAHFLTLTYASNEPATAKF